MPSDGPSRSTCWRPAVQPDRLSSHGQGKDVSLCLTGKSQAQWRRRDLAMVAFRGTVGITVGGSADVACIVEPNSETPAAEAACRRRFLCLARVHARSQEPLMPAPANKQLYNICTSNRERYVKLIFTLHRQESERTALDPRLRAVCLALVPYLAEKFVSFLPV